MKTEYAVKLVGNLRRYRRGKGARDSVWDPEGAYIANNLMPRIPASMVSTVNKLMDKRFDPVEGRKMTSRIEVVDPHDIWTFQLSLKYRGLIYQIKHFDEGQQRSKSDTWQRDYSRLPVLLRLGEKLIVWNGNHRTTAALILGRRLRCRVWRSR